MLTRRATSTPTGVFTHVFGFNHKKLHGKQPELDQYLFRNGLVVSRWWTRWQARHFFQHDVPLTISPPPLQPQPHQKQPQESSNSLLSVPSNNSSFSAESVQRLSFISQRWPATAPLPATTFGGVTVPIPLPPSPAAHSFSSWTSKLNEEAQRQSLKETPSLMAAVRSAVPTHSCHALCPMFLVFSTKDGIWRAVPQQLVGDVSLKLSADEIEKQQFFFDTFALQNQLVRSALKKEFRAEDATARVDAAAANPEDILLSPTVEEEHQQQQQQNPVASALTRSGAGRLNFVLLATDDAIAHNDSLFDPTATLPPQDATAEALLRVTLFPEEQLLPLPNFSSSLMRCPGTKMITRAPFLIEPRDNLLPAPPLQQQQDASKGNNFNNVNDKKSGSTIPIPIPSSVVATLIANSSARKFSSPLWLRANVEGEKQQQQQQRRAETTKEDSKSFFFDCLTPETLLQRLRSRQHPAAAAAAAAAAYSPPPAPPLGAKLTPPTLNTDSPSLLPYKKTNGSDSAPSNGESFAEPSLAGEYKLHEDVMDEMVRDVDYSPIIVETGKDDDEEAHFFVKQQLTDRIRQFEDFVSVDLARVTESSESEAISLSDVPEALARAVLELRVRPQWLRNAALDMMQREQADPPAFKQGKKPIAVKSDIFVMGLFGPEKMRIPSLASRRSIWRRVSKAQSPFAARVSNQDPEKFFFVTVSFLRYVATVQDYEKIAHIVDKHDLQSESLDSFLHKQRVSHEEQQPHSSSSSDQEPDLGAVFSSANARGLGPLRSILEKHLGKLQHEQRLHIARFSRWMRQSAFVNVDQMVLWLEKRRSEHEQEPKKQVDVAVAVEEAAAVSE